MVQGAPGRGARFPAVMRRGRGGVPERIFMAYEKAKKEL